jgi:hypothetical protein
MALVPNAAIIGPRGVVAVRQNLAPVPPPLVHCPMTVEECADCGGSYFEGICYHIPQECCDRVNRPKNNTNENDEFKRAIQESLKTHESNTQLRKTLRESIKTSPFKPSGAGAPVPRTLNTNINIAAVMAESQAGETAATAAGNKWNTNYKTERETFIKSQIDIGLLPHNEVLKMFNMDDGQFKEYKILHLFPPEYITIKNGEVFYKHTDKVYELFKKLKIQSEVPITLELQFQQRIRNINRDGSLDFTEIKDKLYCRPIPLIEGASRQCSVCLDDESDIRRLFKVHYTHGDGDNEVLCLVCLFNHMVSKIPERDPQLENSIDSCECFTKDTCTRQITLYQFYRTIYINQPTINKNKPSRNAEAFLISITEAGLNEEYKKELPLTPLTTNDGKILSVAFLEFVNNRRQRLENIVKLSIENEKKNRIERRVTITEKSRANAIHARSVATMRNAKLRAKKEYERLIELNKRKRASSVLGLLQNLDAEHLKTGVGFTPDFARDRKSHIGPDTMCPYCLTLQQNPTGCLYSQHVDARGATKMCPGLGASQLMLQKFPVTAATGNVPEWCFICGRPSNGHRHYSKLGGNSETTLGDHSTTGCIKSGGGIRTEMILRFNALRDTLLDALERGYFDWNRVLREEAVNKILKYLVDPIQLERAKHVIANKQWDRPTPVIVDPPPPQENTHNKLANFFAPPIAGVPAAATPAPAVIRQRGTRVLAISAIEEAKRQVVLAKQKVEKLRKPANNLTMLARSSNPAHELEIKARQNFSYAFLKLQAAERAVKKAEIVATMPLALAVENAREATEAAARILDDIGNNEMFYDIILTLRKTIEYANKTIALYDHRKLSRLTLKMAAENAAMTITLSQEVIGLIDGLNQKMLRRQGIDPYITSNAAQKIADDIELLLAVAEAEAQSPYIDGGGAVGGRRHCTRRAKKQRRKTRKSD